MEEAWKIGAGYGIAGILAMGAIWLLWYRETKTIPAMLASFSTNHEKSLATFAQQQQLERDQCHRNHQESMEAHKDTRHDIRQLAHVAGLRKAVDDERRKHEDESNNG